MPDPMEIAAVLLAAEGTGTAWQIELLAAEDGYARIAMKIRADMTNGHEMVIGGMTFALADTAFAYACNSSNIRAVGQSASIVYLNPAFADETLTAEARMSAQEKRTGVCNVSVTQAGRMIAQFQGVPRQIGGKVIPVQS